METIFKIGDLIKGRRSEILNWNGVVGNTRGEGRHSQILCRFENGTDTWCFPKDIWKTGNGPLWEASPVRDDGVRPTLNAGQGSGVPNRPSPTEISRSNTSRDGTSGSLFYFFNKTIFMCILNFLYFFLFLSR